MQLCIFAKHLLFSFCWKKMREIASKTTGGCYDRGPKTNRHIQEVLVAGTRAFDVWLKQGRNDNYKGCDPHHLILLKWHGNKFMLYIKNRTSYSSLYVCTVKIGLKIFRICMGYTL